MINVRNRQYSTDGKTGGYPTLQSIWWKYIESEQTVGIPTNKYTYQKLIEYINGIGPYWTQLVEQMIPASTIWNTGSKLENSVLHRQKFVYRRQRGCQFVPVVVPPCYLITNIFDYTCASEFVDFYIYPWLNGDTEVSNFQGILMNRINYFLAQTGLTLNDCILNSVSSSWNIILKIGSQEISLASAFHFGYGINDVPTNSSYRNALIDSLPILYRYGYTYTLNGNLLTITGITTEPKNLGQLVSLQVGINLSISCG